MQRKRRELQRSERRDEVRRKEEDNCRKKDNDEALFSKRKEKRERRQIFLTGPFQFLDRTMMTQIR